MAMTWMVCAERCGILCMPHIVVALFRPFTMLRGGVLEDAVVAAIGWWLDRVEAALTLITSI